MAGIKVTIPNSINKKFFKGFPFKHKTCAACGEKKKIISHVESNYGSGYSDSASSYSSSSDSESEDSDESLSSLSSVSSSVSDSWKS